MTVSSIGLTSIYFFGYLIFNVVMLLFYFSALLAGVIGVSGCTLLFFLEILYSHFGATMFLVKEEVIT